MSKLETYVRFTKDFDWHVPLKGVCIEFKAGTEKRVTRACARQAKKEGAAVSIRPPRREA